MGALIDTCARHRVEGIGAVRPRPPRDVVDQAAELDRLDVVDVRRQRGHRRPPPGHRVVLLDPAHVDALDLGDAPDEVEASGHRRVGEGLLGPAVVAVGQQRPRRGPGVDRGHVRHDLDRGHDRRARDRPHVDDHLGGGVRDEAAHASRVAAGGREDVEVVEHQLIADGHVEHPAVGELPCGIDLGEEEPHRVETGRYREPPGEAVGAAGGAEQRGRRAGRERRVAHDDGGGGRQPAVPAAGGGVRRWRRGGVRAPRRGAGQLRPPGVDPEGGRGRRGRCRGGRGGDRHRSHQ